MCICYISQLRYDEDEDNDDEHWKANYNGVTGLASRVILNFSFFS